MLDDAPSTNVQAALREASAGWRAYFQHELSVEDPDGLELARLGERAEQAEAVVLLCNIANDADAIAMVAYFRRVVATEGRACRDGGYLLIKASQVGPREMSVAPALNAKANQLHCLA